MLEWFIYLFKKRLKLWFFCESFLRPNIIYLYLKIVKHCIKTFVEENKKKMSFKTMVSFWTFFAFQKIIVYFWVRVLNTQTKVFTHTPDLRGKSFFFKVKSSHRKVKSWLDFLLKKKVKVMNLSWICDLPRKSGIHFVSIFSIGKIIIKRKNKWLKIKNSRFPLFLLIN